MRSWFYIGSIAIAASTSFAGCTITATTGGGDGGSAGAEGGSAGSGGATTGGTSARGGTTSASGGSSQGSSQGGSTSASGGATTQTSSQGGSTQAAQGGSSNSGGAAQGGTSTTGSGAGVSSLITQFCAIAPVHSCESTCVSDYTDFNAQFSACESLMVTMLACLVKLNDSAFTCDAGVAGTSSCQSEQDVWYNCTIQ